MHVFSPSKFIVIALMLAGCKPGGKISEAHVRVELSWDGASAESIGDQLHCLGQSMKLAIIDDGRASLYFQGDVPTVESLLESVKGQLPAAVSFSHLTKNGSPIPDAPTVMATKLRREIMVDRDATRAVGVSLDDLSKTVAKLPEPTGETEGADILERQIVPTTNGRKVTLDTLVDSKVIQVTRPLVVDHR
jgi:hypothetical protein